MRSHRLFHIGAKYKHWVLALVLVLGVAGRFVVATRGYNFDMESWKISADIRVRGGNVYAETYRHPYGPVWFLIVEVINRVALRFPDPFAVFRYSIVAFLTLVDILIAVILLRRFGGVAAVAFFLNPISVIITGYHSQIDNLALLLGFTGALLYASEARTASGISKSRIAGLVLLGVSLATKHVLFLFPLWLAFKDQSIKSRLLVLVLPPAIFLLSFVPFWSPEVIPHVFLYRSWNNAPFWKGLIPPVITSYLASVITPFAFFIMALVGLGWLTRKQKPFESLLIYTVAIVVFASAVANQYLVIPVPAIAAFPNWPYALYVFVSTLHLIADADGLHSGKLQQILPHQMLGNSVDHRAYDLPVAILFLGFVLMLLKRGVVTEYFNHALLYAHRRLLKWRRGDTEGE